MNKESFNFRRTYPHHSQVGMADTASPCIYRSGSFDYADLAYLKHTYHIHSLFDLRSAHEIAGHMQSQSTYFNFPMLADSNLPTFPTEFDYLHYYQNILSNNELQIKDLFIQLIEQLEFGSCVIGCFAGKDRTGIICYLIHKILGTEINDIKQDYVASGIALMNREDIFSDNAKKKNLSFAEYQKRFNLCDAVFDCFDAWFNQTYCSIQQYCQSVGLEPNLMMHFKNLLRVAC